MDKLNVVVVVRPLPGSAAEAVRERLMQACVECQPWPDPSSEALLRLTFDFENRRRAVVVIYPTELTFSEWAGRPFRRLVKMACGLNGGEVYELLVKCMERSA